MGVSWVGTVNSPPLPASLPVCLISCLPTSLYACPSLRVCFVIVTPTTQALLSTTFSPFLTISLCRAGQYFCHPVFSILCHVFSELVFLISPLTLSLHLLFSRPLLSTTIHVKIGHFIHSACFLYCADEGNSYISVDATGIRLCNR